MQQDISMIPDVWFTERHLNSTAVSFRVEKVLFSDKSPFQHVSIIETTALGKMLLNDGMVMLSERDEFVYHEMIAHVPLFAHGKAKKVLVIGGGDGGTAREILRHEQIEKCIMVEIDEMVVRACREHIPSVATDFDHPKFELHIEDGVKYMHESEEIFDIIIIDSTDPVGPTTPLFSEEFYCDVMKRLAPDGIVVSQAESPWYDAKTQQGLVQILANVFPRVYVYNFSNLSYPGGSWSFSFATSSQFPFPEDLGVRIGKANLKFQYYNENIHKGAFYLPTFVQRQLADIICSKYRKS